MRASLCLTLFLSVIIELSWTENTTTSDQEPRKEVEVDDGGAESRIENITIELSMEPLPQPSPLIGTFPHDFQLLPGISRRSSYQESSEVHNFDEQGELRPRAWKDLGNNWRCPHYISYTALHFYLMFLMMWCQSQWSFGSLRESKGLRICIVCLVQRVNSSGSLITTT